ncbi:MAG: VCBS repeat-containing protein, partial [Acidobacteriota bacterium]|nr:VCBS repeat-containing protein [Acidobacteriota bacterium]
PTMVDVNGDGREDLVIGYWKGLRKSRLVLDAYLRNSGGGFSIAPRTTTLDPKDGDRSFVQYGHDLTGDDLADLVVRTEEHLLVYVGRSSKSGKNVVEPTPIEIPWQYGRPDEPFEVIITGNGVDSLDRNVSTTRPDVVALDDARPAQILAVFFGKEDLAGWARVVRLQVNN